MKKTLYTVSKFLFVFAAVVLFGCQNNDDDPIEDNNPFLNPPLVNLTLNLNLPEYNPLRFPGNSVILSQQGIRGIVVYCVNTDFYTAFDLSDPNIVPNNCSRMTVEGIIATCQCEGCENSYNIITGQHQTEPETKLPMLAYRITRNGDNIRIRN